MDEEQNSSEQCDLCVVYDHSYLAPDVVEFILTSLKDKGVTYCDIESDILPGQPRLERMLDMIERSTSILIVQPIQEELLNMLKLVCSVCTLSKRCIFTCEPEHQTQGSDAIIISRTPYWIEEVLRRMRSPPILYESDTVAIVCKIPQTTTLFDYMFKCGLENICSTDMNILGIKIMPSSKEVKLDLSYCMKNMESHERYKSDEVMEMLQFIRSMSTQVELKIDTEAENMMDIVSRGVDKIFSTICSCVLDVRGRKLRDWILAYTLSGPLVIGRKIIARIYHSSRHAVIGSSFPDKVQHPDFADESVRQETFNYTNFHSKAASMAKAGFFFDGLRDRARCYYCGGARIDWKETDDPWIMHAEGFPRCPLVKANMSEEFIEEIVLSEFEKTLAGNPDYESVEKRESTLQHIQLTPSRTKNCICKEQFLRDVAEAGFYYVGPEDRVRCFSCGVMLSGIRLRTLEQLLIEHACVSSSCRYVRSKLPPDKVKCVIDTRAVSSDNCLSAVFFVKTYDKSQSSWPSNMLCS